MTTKHWKEIGIIYLGVAIIAGLLLLNDGHQMQNSLPPLDQVNVSQTLMGEGYWR